MENFLPESPKIKYIISKVRPSLFSLNEEEIEGTDIEEKNEFNESDVNKDEKDLKLNKIGDEGYEDIKDNSILKTLIIIYQKKISISSIETKDSL